jgi:HAD superfamily hydrolase (TIGR01549 family)
MAEARRPAVVFFDAGLVLLHPSGRRLQGVVRRVTRQTLPASVFVPAYRRTIHERDLAGLSDANGFPFWPAWCRWAGIAEEHAPALEAEIGRVESDRKKLWICKDPDALPVLEALRGLGIECGVISNTDGELDADLRRAGLIDFLRWRIDSVQVGIEKPDAGIFRLALHRAASSPEDAWMVGDNYVNDIAPALDLGFARAILFDPLKLWSGRPGLDRVTRLSEIAHLAAFPQAQ